MYHTVCVQLVHLQRLQGGECHTNMTVLYAVHSSLHHSEHDVHASVWPCGRDKFGQVFAVLRVSPTMKTFYVVHRPHGVDSCYSKPN